MAITKEKLQTIWKQNEDRIRSALGFSIRIGVILFVSYMLASIVSTFSVDFLSEAAMKSAKSSVDIERPNLRKTLNYRDVRRSVVARNIFNSDGELPDEADPSDGESGGIVGDFNANAQCIKSTLPLQLVGIIYSNNPTISLATVREKGYSEADVYRAGDAILGQEQAVVHAVEADQVVINNAGAKECLEVSEQKSRSFSKSPSSSFSEPVKTNEEASDELSTVQLQSSFVEESLGPGFAKILESGRLVPYNKDGAMVGFKLIGVKSDSLWKKVGLSSGDVITNVNGLSMAQPDKGFALYEALQNERQIRVEFLKKGKAPSNISVEIK